jgi:hypothetical protein
MRAARGNRDEADQPRGTYFGSMGETGIGTGGALWGAGIGTTSHR